MSTTCSQGNNYCQQCSAPLTFIQISHHQRFCSRTCKANNQKKSIFLRCLYCNKEFSINPYLKRNSNYCSRECYWNANRAKRQRFCLVCGKRFMALACHINKGFGKFCSRDCQFRSYELKRVSKVCPQCDKQFFVPPSINELRKFCSKKCKDNHERDYVKRRCHNCKKYFFLPRWELNKGKGTFCSRKCFQNYIGETSIEALIRKVLGKKGIDFKQEARIGKYYADFLIPNSRLIIECDGEYWHRSDFAKRRDFKKDEFLTSKGYEVHRFTEKEIKESLGGCVEKAFAHFRW